MQRREELIEREEQEMTTDSHSGSSQGSHSRMEDAKVNGISQEDFDREKAEIDFQIGILMKMLQKSVWTMRKRVKWPRLRERRNQQVRSELVEELRKIEQILSAQEESEKLRGAEVELEVNICRPEQGEMLGEEDNDRSAEDLLDYWQSSEQFEDMVTKEVDQAMKPCDFDSYSLCMLAGCAGGDGQPHEVVTRNVDLEVKYDGESLLEEEGVDLLKQKEFIDEILFGVKQSNEVDINQQSEDNSIVGLQKGKPMNLFNGIDERCLQYDDVESRSTQEECQEKNESEKENCDDLLERFYKEIEFLERLLEEPKGETKPTELNGGKGAEDNITKYDAEINEIEQRLYEGENEFEESIKLQKCRSWQQNEEPEMGLIVQRKISEDRRYRWRLKKRVKWKLLQQRWNSKLMNEFRKLEQIHIDLKSPQEGSDEIPKIYGGGLVLEASKENRRYCILKTKGCCVFAGPIDLRKDKQLLKIVQEMTTHSHMQTKEDGKRIFEFKGYTESLKIIDLEESQSAGGLKTAIADNAANKDGAELLRELPDKIADLYKSNLLMRKLARNEELQIRVSKTAAKYEKMTAADSEALHHKGERLEEQTTTAVIKDKLSNQVWDP